MEPYGTYYNTPPQQQVMYMHSQDPNYSHFYANGQGPPPLPTKNTFPKVKKKSVLKTQLTAIKNAFIKTTKPLRRMNSMVEPERKLKPILKRQHSMMERQIGQLEYPNEMHTYPRQIPPPQQPIYSRQPYQYYPQEQQDLNSTYTNLEQNDIYGSTDKRAQYQSHNADDIYSNRASIDLERRQGGGRRIVRRHSLADRTGARRQQFVQHQEDIYQSRQGAFMVEPRRLAPNSEVMQRRRFYAESEPQSPTTEEPIYMSRREMHRNHLYQSRKEMQDRIAAGKNTTEREFSPQTSSSHSSVADDRSDKENISSRTDKDIYQSRREMRLLREQIYQTRRDAMESMAEPSYVSRRDLSGRPEPIYESKEERTNEADDSKLPSSSAEETLSNSKHSNETIIETTIRTKQPDEAISNAENGYPPIYSTTSAVVHESPEEEPEEEDESTLAPLPTRPSPFHISNMIKRTAPPPLTSPPPVAASRTSLETQYTSSQASLAVGPPNATSTPYASDMSLPLAPQVRTQAIPLRNTTTTTGVFDEKGGTLCDKEWNVSLLIPPGAIPAGIKQEIYFTVSDPRLGQAAAGAPPLDMENGLCFVYLLLLFLL